MKHFNIHFRAMVLAFFVSLACTDVRADRLVDDADADSVEISLLTCGPGREVYSLYGHTAIRYNDLRTGEDIVVNYGLFSFKQNYFVLRFIFGLTDYQMGITSFSDFMAEYRSEERWVCQQTLNLTAADKLNIKNALIRNYAPENRVYRYNFFYNNCTTKARDIIVGHVSGQVVYPPANLEGVSFRRLLHQWNGNEPWSRLGNDLLLGVGADFQVNMSERQFLPDSLRKDFDDAYIQMPSGERRKLVSRETMLYQPAATENLMTTSATPMMVASVLLMVIILITVAERYTGRLFFAFDVLWLTVAGLGGLVLLAMVFSKHPTVSVNYQIFILCPVDLIAVFPIVKKLRHHIFSRWLWLVAALIVLALVLGLWQYYNPAVWLLALSLLLRIAVLNYRCKKNNKIR